MTYTSNNRHQKNNFKFLFILGLIPIFFGVIFLVMIYNKTVDVRHGIANAKLEMQRIEAGRAEAQEKMLREFSRSNIETFAQEHGLVLEKSPRYILVDNNPKWEVASQY